MAIAESLGEAIQARYIELGMTREQFAKLVGVYPSSVSRWVGTSNIAKRYWPRIEKALGKSQEELTYPRRFPKSGSTGDNVSRETHRGTQNAAQPPRPATIRGEEGPDYVKGLRAGLRLAGSAIRALELQAGEGNYETSEFLGVEAVRRALERMPDEPSQQEQRPADDSRR